MTKFVRVTQLIKRYFSKVKVAGSSPAITAIIQELKNKYLKFLDYFYRIMRYKYLNEVLLNWNPEEDLQDNNIIKSSDIKKEIDIYFIYKVSDLGAAQIHIFDNGSLNGWPDFKKYKDKVYINNEHIELNDAGYTVKYYNPGEYKVYIEDINKITSCTCMFYRCNQLVSVPLFDTSRVREMNGMFNFCSNLISVPSFDTHNVYTMSCMFSGCKNLRSVPMFNIDNVNVKNMSHMFADCGNLNQKTINVWSSVYDFGKKE